MTAIRIYSYFALLALLGLGAQVGVGADAPELRYKVRYDLEIIVGVDSRSFGSRTYVPAGAAIPVKIDDYRAEIIVSQTKPGHYEAEIVVSKIVGDDQSEAHVARTVISGTDGASVSFTWQTESMISIRFEIVASGDRR